MRFFDLIALILDNLGRRKARVVLTAIGVVIGTAAVVVLISLAIGLQQNATQQLYGIGDLTQIQVYPNYEEAAYVEGGSGPKGSMTTQTLITDQTLEDLAAIPGVVAVIPRDYFNGSSVMKYKRLEAYAGLLGAKTDDLALLGLKAQQGVTETKRGTAVIGALVTTGFYDPKWRPGQEMPTPPELIDQTIQLVLIKWDPQDGTEIRKTVQLKIVGILEESRGESDWSVYLQLDDLTKYNE